MEDKTLCPCGSGKSQLYCCGASEAASLNIKLVVVWAGILVTIGGITALVLSQPQSEDQLIEAVADATPQPWQYNAVTNQHWDPRPGHEHWHTGPVPADTNALASEVSIGSPGNEVFATPIDPSDLPPALRDPLPWQFDPVNNQHWDPTEGHKHWHAGPPPAGATPADAPTPGPWEYDADNDRHWDPSPGHNHWHAGPPPQQ